jgi:hypothetical protein
VRSIIACHPRRSGFRSMGSRVGHIVPRPSDRRVARKRLHERVRAHNPTVRRAPRSVSPR